MEHESKSMSKIKPCPFCGAVNVCLTDWDVYNGDGLKNMGVMIYCLGITGKQGCGANLTVYKKTCDCEEDGCDCPELSNKELQNKAIKAWNRRAK
jgi:hypothetical protein